MGLVEKFTHESWFAAAGTAAGYGFVLVAMFVLLFVIPFLIFLAL